MTHDSRLERFSVRLTSRRGAWIVLALTLAVVLGVFGLVRSAGDEGSSATTPATSQSALVAAALPQFPDAGQASVLVVASRTDGSRITPSDVAALDALGAELATSPSEAPRPITSVDGRAAVLAVPIDTRPSHGDVSDEISAIRDHVASASPPGLSVQVTGGPAFAADITAAFDGADLTLLLVTILIVALLLIATYRSPILWLLPLSVVAVADGLAGRLTALAGSTWDLQFDSGVVSVLVFGAGTNYALLLISRYREELQTTVDHRRALSVAWRRTVPAIVASNVTVVIALLTLALAVTPATHGLGISSAIGLLVTLAAALLTLPALLAVCGRRVFWPRVPRPDQVHHSGRAWRGVASLVMRRPAASLTAGLAVLGIMALGLLGTSVGLNQIERFREKSQSAVGLEVLAEHFPPGQAQPIVILTDTSAAHDVEQAVASVAGIDRVSAVSTTPDQGRTKLVAISDYVPSTPESLAQVSEIRRAVEAVPAAHTIVGGAVAADVDARDAAQRDLTLIAPLILLECLLILVLLLRSFLAPVLLVAVNVASAVAAIGAGSWLSRVLLGQPALDLAVPLLAFLFLIALGIDYTIFLVHRARAEARKVGTRAGMVEALGHTGAVITSAGIVLAAVFAALGVLPLVTLGQLGLIVGVGVLIDTLVVRTAIVPAIFGLVGDRIWWPARITRRPAQWRHEPDRAAAVSR